MNQNMNKLQLIFQTHWHNNRFRQQIRMDHIQRKSECHSKESER